MKAKVVSALMAKGWPVETLTHGRILVGVKGLNILLMLKGRWIYEQDCFRAMWHGQCATVTSAEDAVLMVQTIVKANWEQ